MPRQWPVNVLMPPAWLGAVPAVQLESHFGDRVLRCLVERPRSLHALLAAAVRTRPQAEALIDTATRFSWAQLEQAVGEVADGLRKQGLQRGERVILLMRNRAEFVIAFFAVARLGAISVPVSVRSAPPEVVYIAQQCRAAAVVADAALATLAPSGVDAPLLRLRLSADVAAPPGWIGWSALRGGGARLGVDEAAMVDEADTAVILYTSGTTGRPKGAELTHLGIVHSAMHFQICMALGPPDRSAVAVPLSHVTGLVAQLCTMAHVQGALLLIDGFKAAAFLPLAARERVTHTVMVPAMYQLCLMQPDLALHDLSCWRIGAYGGAPMAPATIAALASALPKLLLMNAYGATETTSPATVMPPSDTARLPDSVGRAVPCAELRIVDPDGRTLPAGETGEVWIRGPMVVRGYWDNPQATAESITDGFWHSGDIGRLDAQGNLYVLDRLKDVINRGGYKVFSSEVEAVLLQHPAVVEAAVIGVPCPVLGERVRAVVCLREAVADAALAAWCAERVADYKVPEQWRCGAQPLPRNANGKVMKRMLRDAAD